MEDIIQDLFVFSPFQLYRGFSVNAVRRWELCQVRARISYGSGLWDNYVQLKNISLFTPMFCNLFLLPSSCKEQVDRRFSSKQKQDPILCSWGAEIPVKKWCLRNGSQTEEKALGNRKRMESRRSETSLSKCCLDCCLNSVVLSVSALVPKNEEQAHLSTHQLRKAKELSSINPCGM